MADVTQRVTVWYADGYWWWKCAYCLPPTIGRRRDWARIFSISLPHHFKVRSCHHDWAACRAVCIRARGR
jgi:hypothetical protein